MQIALRLRSGGQSDNYDLLGKQLLLAKKFFESGFRTNLLLEDAVRAGEKLTAGEIFVQAQGGKWVMDSDSLPGDVSIKSIALDKNRLFVETAWIDWEIFHSGLLPRGFEQRAKKGFYEKDSGKMVIQIVSPLSQSTWLEFGLSPRCILISPWAKLDKRQRRASIKIADRLYSANAFKKTEETTTAVVGNQTLEIKLGLHQKLIIEQRPVLALQGELLTDTRLEVNAIILREKILGMNEEQFQEFAQQDTSPAGCRKTASVYLLALTKKVKDANPQLSWKRARQVAIKVLKKELSQPSV